MLEKDKVYLADALANISHQLKTPLTSMMVMTELLEDSDEAKRKQFVETIGQTVRENEMADHVFTEIVKIGCRNNCISYR